MLVPRYVAHKGGGREHVGVVRVGCGELFSSAEVCREGLYTVRDVALENAF